MNNQSDLSNSNENLILPAEKKNWVSPEIKYWNTEQIAFGGGPGPDGTSRAYIL